MAGAQGHSILQLKISNKTRNTSLKYQRCKYLWSSFDFPHPAPELPSGHSDSGFLLSLSNALGHGWLAIYEADSFTLAIFFFLLRKEPEFPPKMLQLELSLDKAHLGDFRETFDRMAVLQDPPNPDQTVVSRTEFSGSSSKVSVRLLTGRYKVSANVTRDLIPDLKVQVEERVIVPMCGPF
ncbi:unnamed protein product [Coccothraustes coccothraustes]